MKAKSVTRVDGTRTHGWQVRVRWRGRTLPSKFFSDGVWGGKRKAFAAAVAHRDALEERVSKPRTERWVQSLFPRNASGEAGIREGLRREYGRGRKPVERRVFFVTYPKAPGVVGTTSVSIEKWGYQEALRRARQIRQEQLAAYQDGNG